MEPYRVVRSEADLEAVATDSLVCPAYFVGLIYEKAAPNQWVEPGCEESIPTAAAWEVMTGSYDGLVMDEDREVWVLIDAAAPRLVRPERPAGSPDYATRVQLRSPEFLTHHSLEEARRSIEDAVGDGVTAGHTNIWRRPRNACEYRSILYIAPGTSAADLPWNAGGAVSAAADTLAP